MNKMSRIMDKILTPLDLGAAVKEARRSRRLTAVSVAERSARSRDILHRLEQGGDVSVRALLDILSAMDMAIQLVPRGVPSLAEMRKRFGESDE
jgi:DNA-binding phage protein